MLIDRLLPQYDFAELHAVRVAASPAAVEAGLRDLDLGRSRIVRLLLRLRGMPRKAGRFDTIERGGFRILAHEPEREIVLGLIGRFWTPSGGLCRFDVADFEGFDEPGWAKAVWGFRMTPLDDGHTRLETETRVRCTDPGSRRRFRMYWALIRPFSGLIRRVALRQVKRTAEARAGGRTPGD